MPTIILQQEIQELAGIGTWVWDVEPDTMSWSAEAYRIFERDASRAVKPSDMPRFRASEGQGAEAHALREALRSGTRFEIVHPAITEKGRRIWLRSTGRVERTGDRSTRMFGLVQDVTAEQEAKLELERSRTLLEEISALSGIGGWGFDAAANRVEWSKETRRIYEAGDGFEPTPESLKALFAPGTLDIQDACIQRAIQTGAPAECEFDAITLSGRAIRVRSVCRVELRDGQIVGISGIVQDVTRQREIERTLGRAEQLLDDISRLTGVGGWEVNGRSASTVWTSQVRRIFEAPDTFEPTEAAVAQLMPPESVKLVSAAVRQAAVEGRPFDIEFDAVTLSGRAIRVRSIGHPERSESQLARVVGTLEDVTAQRKTETDRRRQEALNEQVSRLAGIGGWEFDLRTNETIWSAQVRKIFDAEDGFNPSPEDHERYLAPESREIVAQARRRAVVEGLPAELDFQAITAKGRRIWVRNIYQPERVAGRTVRLYGTAQDVTAARAVQEEMEVLHARLTAAIEAAELRVWEIDLESGVVQWTHHLPPAFVRPGTTPATGPEVLDYIHPEDRDGFQRHARDVVSTGAPSVVRVRVRTPEGDFRIIEIRMRLLSASPGARKILGVSRDVTREVTLTDDIIRKQREAEESSLAKSQFVARMSHEIRTPMSGVIGMLDVLLRAEVDPTKRSHAATALKSARDLMSVLDDIIDVSQLESRHLSLEYGEFSISAVVNDVVTLFGTLAREKSLALIANVSSSVPEWVVGDPRRVRQVLTNLVGNAVKFTSIGKVEISAGYDAATGIAQFSVLDTGEGIPANSIDKVFDQFFQADSSATRRHGGSGLGLAISKQLVGMMGGEIRVESKMGEGSVFSFSVLAPAGSAPSPDLGEPQAQPAQSLRILVAEDNREMQKILRALLEAGGHALTIVGDGREAVAAAASATFDVILMDVMMPVMDGPTATQRIRELGGRAGGIPIIALTANALVGDRDRYLAVGMTDYLSKPIDVAALFAALARVPARP